MTVGRPPPLVVVAGDGETLQRVLTEVRSAGWRVVSGWGLTADGATKDGPAPVCVGRVSTLQEAQLALLAAVHGAGLIVHLDAPTEDLAPFVEDLRHVGPVEFRTEGSRSPPPLLTKEQIGLLRLLSSGATVSEAAREVHVSRRTAARYLAAARDALGASNVAEALLLAERRGWL